MEWNKLLNNNRLRQTTRSNPSDARNDFESDFGRIVFSPALRRMHDKTQVFPLTTDDNIHSRLTHSMEVLSVAYSMGVKICEEKKIQERCGKNTCELFREIPIILKNSSLLHDIGNPPFGHFGETVIQEYFNDFFKNHAEITDENIKEDERINENGKIRLYLTEEQKNDFCCFDGNAQGLRILTKLQILNDSYGLNLTYATLSSYIKYPNFETPNKEHKFIEKHKLGIFQSELEYFKKISKECGTIADGRYLRHPLSFIMEAADSICYLTMDIEDGFNKKLFDIDYLLQELSKIGKIKDKIADIVKDETNETTKIVKIRIELIQILVNYAVDAFINNLDKIENGTYNEELIFSNEFDLPKVLQKICKDKIFSYRDINSLEITGHSIISGIFDYYIDFLFRKNKDYRKRAKILISGSIIRAAIEENFNEIIEKRKRELSYELKEKKKSLKEKNENSSSLEEEVSKLKKRLTDIREAEKELESLIKKHQENLENKDERKKIEKEINEKKTYLRDELIKPEIDDLTDYYKLRIIVDFVSGMTDQYALNHFRKISGQQIN